MPKHLPNEVGVKLGKAKAWFQLTKPVQRRR